MQKKIAITLTDGSQHEEAAGRIEIVGGALKVVGQSGLVSLYAPHAWKEATYEQPKGSSSF